MIVTQYFFRVEIDCSGIFKAGQLGVAMSRSTTTECLRVINFNKKFVIPPPHKVIEFMDYQSKKIISPDFLCCREYKGEVFPLMPSSPDPELAETFGMSTHSTEIEDTEANVESLDSDIEDDFNDIISSICHQEEKCTNFELPEDFNISLEEMKFHNETTEFHEVHNRTLSHINKDGLNLFLKKVFLKCQEFKKK
ncbi:uncharacterized protein LOC123555841 [Mercenaria mercenaria]|uniref:uncharacterized protein LOC123555841 n=1 Tax=Mercenaria mercenaria TaxID=6596 RepID=UPI00234ECCF2|nr:uncharacterized protein LOC123555841 [Mercenaria mercenaria]